MPVPFCPLKLITETLALCDNRKALAAALEQTVTSIHAKRQQGTTQAFKNHSYLNKVLESTKEQFYHPVNQVKKETGSSVQIKSYSQVESPEESNRLHQEMMNKLKRGK